MLGMVVVLMVERVERPALYYVQRQNVKRCGRYAGGEFLSGLSRWPCPRDGTVWGLNNHNGTILLGKWGLGERA